MKTHTELSSLLSTFTESLAFSLGQFPGYFELTPAKVSSPLDELVKLTKLIKAHTTKVGIVFKPENTKPEDLTAAYTTTEQLMNTVNLLATIICQLTRKPAASQAFQSEIIYLINQLFQGLKILVKECLEILDADADGESRLVSVGKVWGLCDEIVPLVLGGQLAFLSHKIGQSLTMIDDGFDEFKEWAENPETMEFDDMFDDFSDSESDDEEAAVPTPKIDSSKKDELRLFAKKWVKKVELARLLVASFKKSVPKAVPSETVDELIQLQHKIVISIDKFITDLMCEATLDDELDKFTETINKTCLQLCTVALDMHNEKKGKWYSTWQIKYDEI